MIIIKQYQIATYIKHLKLNELPLEKEMHNIIKNENVFKLADYIKDLINQSKDEGISQLSPISIQLYLSILKYVIISHDYYAHQFKPYLCSDDIYQIINHYPATNETNIYAGILYLYYQISQNDIKDRVIHNYIDNYLINNHLDDYLYHIKDSQNNIDLLDAIKCYHLTRKSITK